MNGEFERWRRTSCPRLRRSRDAKRRARHLRFAGQVQLADAADVEYVSAVWNGHGSFHMTPEPWTSVADHPTAAELHRLLVRFDDDDHVEQATSATTPRPPSARRSCAAGAGSPTSSVMSKPNW